MCMGKELQPVDHSEYVPEVLAGALPGIDNTSEVVLPAAGFDGDIPGISEEELATLYKAAGTTAPGTLNKQEAERRKLLNKSPNTRRMPPNAPQQS